MSEMEVEAFMDFAGVQFADENLFYEMVRAHHREIAREGKDERCIDAGFGEQTNATLAGSDELEIFVGMKNADGMRIEGDDHGF